MLLSVKPGSSYNYH